MAWMEGFSKVETIVKDLATILTALAPEDHRWVLEHPASVDDVVDKAILSTTTTKGLTAYLCIEHPQKATNHYYVTFQIGSDVDVSGDALTGVVSEKAKFHWFNDGIVSPVIQEWLPITYWLDITVDRVALVLMGDPSADFSNYLISFGYVGAIESFVGGDNDADGNFALTVSSAVEPVYAKTYGDRTATGVTDFVMLKTRSGFPCQAHLPAFDTPHEFAERNFQGPSTWTHKYPASQVSIWHGYDNRRGKLIDVLVVDKSGIVHTDELVEDKSLPTEKTYKFFNINAPYSFLNNGPNVLYGVAIRKGAST